MRLLYYDTVKIWRILIKTPRHKILLSFIESWRHSSKIRIGWPGNPDGANGLSFLHTCPGGHEAHLVSCTIDTGAHFRGPRSSIDHPPLSTAEVKDIVHLYKYSVHLMVFYGLTFIFTFKYVDDPKVSQTATVMNKEMGSTSGIWTAKVNKVNCAKNTMYWRRAT